MSNIEQRESYPEASQTLKMLFVKIVKGSNPFIIFQKSSILDVWLSSEYMSKFSCKRNQGWWGTDIPNTHEKLMLFLKLHNKVARNHTLTRFWLSLPNSGDWLWDLILARTNACTTFTGKDCSSFKVTNGKLIQIKKLVRK